MIDYLKRARRATLDGHVAVSDPVTRFHSGQSYAYWRAASGPTRRHSKGLVLDAGSGRGAWRAVVETSGARREALDIDATKVDKLDWLADLRSMPQVPSERFDTVVCHQVLEHIAHPAAALQELNRVLKVDGVLVLSVPHLSRLHDLPHDYFRYTPAGLRVLLGDAGFDVLEVTPYGGLLTFIHHQVSTLVLGLAAAVRPLYYATVAINAPLSVLSAVLDRLVDRPGLVPNGLVVVARKRAKPD